MPKGVFKQVIATNVYEFKVVKLLKKRALL